MSQEVVTQLNTFSQSLSSLNTALTQTSDFHGAKLFTAALYNLPITQDIINATNKHRRTYLLNKNDLEKTKEEIISSIEKYQTEYLIFLQYMQNLAVNESFLNTITDEAINKIKKELHEIYPHIDQRIVSPSAADVTSDYQTLVDLKNDYIALKEKHTSNKINENLFNSEKNKILLKCQFITVPYIQYNKNLQYDSSYTSAEEFVYTTAKDNYETYNHKYMNLKEEVKSTWDKISWENLPNFFNTFFTFLKAKINSLIIEPKVAEARENKELAHRNTLKAANSFKKGIVELRHKMNSTLFADKTSPKSSISTSDDLVNVTTSINSSYIPRRADSTR